MPPKTKGKKTKSTTIKGKPTSVKQVVNVNVSGGRKGSRMQKQSPAPAQLDSGLNVFKKQPISIVLQTPSLSSQANPLEKPSYLNEYNMLLKELADERKARLDATAPLTPNPTPLTTNQQVNQLLNIPVVTATPINEVTNKFREELIDDAIYDAPYTDENMLTTPPNLSYNLSQKLPVSNFDYDDLRRYSNENQDEQSALVSEARAGGGLGEGEVLGALPTSEEEFEITPKPRKSRQTKPEKLQPTFEEYVNEVRRLNERFNLEIKTKTLKDFRTKQDIIEEIQNVKKRAVEKTEQPQLKVGMFFEKKR